MLNFNGTNVSQRETKKGMQAGKAILMSKSALRLIKNRLLNQP